MLPAVADRYALLDSGAALGRGNGPLLVRRAGDRSPIRRVAVPGVHTTANALMMRLFPRITERTPLLFSQIAAAVGIPLMHIADVTARQLHMAGVQRVGLLGTRYTMEEDFYTGRLEANGLQVLVPEAEDRAEINRVIFEELCRGVIKDSSRETFLRAIRDLAARGAQGVILGCTEIGMLVQQENIAVPLFDTTLIHARTAALVAINETPVDTEPVKVKQ